LLGRTQANGKDDFPAVHAIKKQYTLTPASVWGKPYTPPEKVPVEPGVDRTTPPVQQVAKMDAAAFFERPARAMKANPPPAAHAGMVDKLARLGNGTGTDSVLCEAYPAGPEGLERAVA